MSLEIEGYTGLTEVGRGGFGVVYRAQDARFGREVAVKAIRDAGLGKDVLARFERECLALGILSGHPNIVAVHDNGSTVGGEFYLVMEFLGGGSLAQRLAARGPAAPEDVVAWGVALAGALETAHGAGIVHRDVKPENILFSSYGAPKLVDFGIARMRSAYETRSGFISATLSHAAPEVVAGSPVQPAADVYSLASVLFTALRGRPPFDQGPEDSLAPLIARIAGAAPPDLRPDGIPDEVVAVVERGLAKTADERYADAAAFGRALQDVARSVYGREVVLPIGGAEQTAEAAAVAAVEVSGTAGTVQRNAAALAPAPTPSVTPVVPTPPRRRRTALLAVAGLVVAALGAWAVAGRGDDGTNLAGPGAMPTVSGLPGGGLPGGVGFSGAEVKTGPLTARRDYAFVGTDRVGTTVELRNTSSTSVTRLWVEVVPKDVAVRVGQVSFAPETSGVIEEDPIVYWKVKLAPGTIRTIAWTTAIPAGREQGQELLDDVRTWHAAAVKESSARVAAAVKTLDGAGITTGTDPTLGAGGRTVTPTSPGPGPGPGAGPSLSPGGGGPVMPTGGAPVVTTGPGGPGTTTTAGPTGPAGTANGRPTVTVRAQKSNELAGVSYTFGVKDPDGDTWTVRSVTGLPAGLGWSGTRISGTVSQGAATATTNFRNGLGQVAKTVKVTVADARGAVTTVSFTWTVVDTHRLMPDYRNKWGDGSDGLPNVSHISSQSFTVCYDATAEVDRIAKQSKTPGSVLRYGDPVTYTYYTRDTSAPAC